jgi:hypothetical protein
VDRAFQVSLFLAMKLFSPTVCYSIVFPVFQIAYPAKFEDGLADIDILGGDPE